MVDTLKTKPVREVGDYRQGMIFFRDSFKHLALFNCKRTGWYLWLLLLPDRFFSI